MSAILHDVRFGLRQLGRQKALSLAAVATLGLCIGAAITAFSIVNAVVLRPLPFRGAERFVYLHNSYPRAGVDVAGTGVPDYFDCRAETGLFEEVAAFRTIGQTVGAGGEAERRPMMVATPSLFRLLHARPLAGRTFTEEDAEPGNERKVILGYELWQRLAGGRLEAIGRDVRINEVPHRVVGVMPAGFVFWSAEVAAWIPAAYSAADRADSRRHNNSLHLVAGLKPGVSIEAARRRIEAMAAANLDRLPDAKPMLVDAGYRMVVRPLQDYLVSDVRRALYLLWGGSLFVLLIGCVNIANLALVRSSGRTKEFATRLALGARPGHLARQTLAEAVVLAVLGGAAGLLLGRWGLVLVRTLGLERLPRAFEIAFDLQVLAYTLALVVFIALVVGLVPMASLRQRMLGQAVREEGRSGTASRGANRARRVMVVVQVALALVLLAGSALLFASFQNLLAENHGFRVDQVWSGLVNLPAARYAEDADIVGFQQRLLERLRTVPGVSSVGLTDAIPFGPGGGDSVIFAEGHTPRPGESVVSPYQTRITPGYFETMGVRLLRGRFFAERDEAAAPRVIIIDDRLARHFWPGADPIGRRMWTPQDPRMTPPADDSQLLTVVGVVNAIRVDSVSGEGDRPGAVYYPMSQDAVRTLFVAARSPLVPASLTASIRAELRRLDPELPLSNVRTLVERRDMALQTRRTPLVLSVAFGAVALMLAAIGLYGVLAYQVAQRRREIAIRMALGGHAALILRLVLREGIAMVAAGAAVGLAGVAALARVLQSQLFGVQASDPLIIGATVALIGVVTVAACLLPARRAARTDPARALGDL